MITPSKENKGSEAGPSGVQLIKVADVRKKEEKVIKETGIQTEMDWEKNMDEMEYFMRIYKTLAELKTAEELIALGQRECPDLDADILKRIVAVQFPKEKKEEGRISLPGTSSEKIPQVSAEEMTENKEGAKSVEKDLQLSDSDDSLEIIFTSSEEE